MDNDNKRACECGQCFFLAESGSKYCKHHRNVMENYDGKYARVEGEAAPAPQAATPKYQQIDNLLNEMCGVSQAEAPQAATPNTATDNLRSNPYEIYEAVSQAEAPRPSAPNLYDLLIADGWHVSDGVDSCSGHDEDYMRDSAKVIAEMLAPSVAESRPSAPGIADVVQVHHWESRPSAEEVQQLAQQWVWENAAITITPERLADFYQWMQERITRP
jgi:hypothetical protein